MTSENSKVAPQEPFVVITPAGTEKLFDPSQYRFLGETSSVALDRGCEPAKYYVCRYFQKDEIAIKVEEFGVAEPGYSNYPEVSTCDLKGAVKELALAGEAIPDDLKYLMQEFVYSPYANNDAPEDKEDSQQGEYDEHYTQEDWFPFWIGNPPAESVEKNVNAQTRAFFPDGLPDDQNLVRLAILRHDKLDRNKRNGMDLAREVTGEVKGDCPLAASIDKTLRAMKSNTRGKRYNGP